MKKQPLDAHLARPQYTIGCHFSPKLARQENTISTFHDIVNMTIRTLKSYTIACFHVTILLSNVIETGCTSHGSVLLQKKPLECFECYSENKGEVDSCQVVNMTIGNKMTKVTTCSDSDNYCMVRNFTFTKHQNNNEAFAVERNCSKDCKTECISVGERNQYRLRMCTSCCQEPYCNYGNGASNIFSTLPIIIAFLIIACFAPKNHCNPLFVTA